MPERPGPVVDALPSARPALDLSSAVRSRVRESLVREGVRANLLAEVTPSEAAIVDAVARGAEVVRSHPRDIDALRQAAAGLLFSTAGCSGRRSARPSCG